jgi:hypothetical protein
MPELMFMKLGMYVITPEPISMEYTYFINPARQPVCQIHEMQETKKNCWTRCFLCGPCSIKGESVGLSAYPFIVARQWQGKHVPEARNNWRRPFLCGPYGIKGK